MNRSPLDACLYSALLGFGTARRARLWTGWSSRAGKLQVFSRFQNSGFYRFPIGRRKPIRRMGVSAWAGCETREKPLKTQYHRVKFSRNGNDEMDETYRTNGLEGRNPAATQTLCGIVRLHAAMCGYVRLCADFGKQGPAVVKSTMAGKEALTQWAGIIFTTMIIESSGNNADFRLERGVAHADDVGLND